MEFDEKYLWQYISIAPPGLDRSSRRDPRLAEPRLGLNSDRCFAALLRDYVQRSIMSSNSHVEIRDRKNRKPETSLSIAEPS